MDLDHLALLVELAEAGSFADLARRHDLDPSLISRRIGSIEAELGARLFHRTTRSLAPTEAGARFLRRAQGVLDEFELARAEAASHTQSAVGTLRLTASVGFAQVCVVPLLKELHQLYPRLRIELLASDANLDLAAEGVDLAIRLAPRPAGDFVASKLADTHYRVVASPAFLESTRLDVPQALSQAPCLCFPLPGFRTKWRFLDGTGRVLEVPVSGPIEATTSLALRALARDGVGPALLADWLIDADIAAGRLVPLFTDHRVTATDFDTAAWLIYPSRKFLPFKTRAVIEFLRVRLGGRINRT